MGKIIFYHELIQISTFKERFEYCRLNGVIGEETFGWLRQYNQKLYTSPEWRSFHDYICVRDQACDLAFPDRRIRGSVYVHHLNPLTPDDVINRSDACFDEDNVVCVSFDTHQRITYGLNLPDSLFYEDPVERRPYDTSPWRKT